MDKHSVSEYLNEYINNFNNNYMSGGLVGGNISTDVTSAIAAGNFKAVIDYYFEPLAAGAIDDILTLKLKSGPGTSPNPTTGSNYTIREEFINNQVAIVTQMLQKIDSIRRPATGLGANPGGFLSEFFNSLYGGSSGQSGGMTGGLRAADVTTNASATDSTRALYLGPFGIAALVAGPGPVTTPTTGPVTVDLTQLIINFVNGNDTIPGAPVKPVLSNYTIVNLTAIDRGRIDNGIDKSAGNNRRTKKKLNIIINDLSAVWNSEADRTNKKSLNTLRNDLNSIRNF